jgi:predicted transposase YbfD/YdcC
MVVRSIQRWNKTTHEVQFYITSLASDANKIGSAIRQHWGLKILFIGHWMSLSMKMNVGFVLYTAHRILLCYVALPSMP